jgi:acyl-CoA synthetase
LEWTLESATGLSLAQIVRQRAGSQPDALAFITSDSRLTWAQYDSRAESLARRLVAQGLEVGARIAVVLPDGPAVHVAFLAIEKAGCVIVGIGARSGRRELEHLLGLTECVGIVSGVQLLETEAAVLVRELRTKGFDLRHHLIVNPESGELLDADDSAKHPAKVPSDGTRAGPEEVLLDRMEHAGEHPFLLNSTSGTTGMPKCVIHDQARWFAFHQFALEAGRLCDTDVFMSLVPAPFGFGIWTAHVTPTLIGVPTVLMSRFSADEALGLIERHGVTVLAAVSTQFIMMLSAEKMRRCDFKSLRVLFTGGEAVPRERAEAFEEQTGARVLQFYGSNEVGAVSRTTLDDPRDKRLGTAGRVIKEMNVRLFDQAGNDVTGGGRGQPGCRGPTLSGGYYKNPKASKSLMREDGWMMLGDIVTIDDEGYLCVVGRTDDFIIRGGKNISAVAVETQVGSHPAVTQVAVVAMPDPVFGERVCAFVELRTGQPLDLDDLRDHLRLRGVSKEYFPERLVVLEALPRAAGGKVAKGELRARVAAGENESQ